MDSLAILWTLVIAGGVLAIVQAWWLQSRVVNVDAATQVLIKILTAGNRERALRLTNAAPQAVYMRAVRRVLEAESQTRDALQTRFDEALAEDLRSLGTIQNAGYLAILLGGLGIGLAATASTPVIPVVGTGAMVIVIALHGLKRLGKLAPDARAGFARLLDVIVAAPAAPPPLSTPAEAAASVRTATATAASPHDLVLVATVDGREIARRKLDENVIKIGKMASTQFFLDHPSVSRIHAIVEVTDEHAQIIDLGSMTGTKHNGNTVNKAELVAGDVLQLGDVRIEVVAGSAANG